MKIFLIFLAFLVPLFANAIPKKVTTLKLTKLSSPMFTSSKGTYVNKRPSVLANRNITLTEYIDNVYAVSIDFGTPSQTMWFLVGSEFPMFEVTLCSKANETGCFDASASSTYGGFSNPLCGCWIGEDSFSLAGLSVQKQTFATDPMTYTNPLIAGTLFLGPPLNYGLLEVIPPLISLKPMLDKPVFSIWLDRHAKPSFDGSNGQLTLGAYDTQNCDSNITSFQISSQAFWQFTLSGISVGSYSNIKNKQVGSFIETSYLGGPQQDVDAIMEQIGAHKDQNDTTYYVPCNATGLPDIVFIIGGNKFNIPSWAYTNDVGLTNGNCEVKVISNSNDGFGPDWAVGAPFIRAWCHHYDFENFKIGFSKAHHSQI